MSPTAFDTNSYTYPQLHDEIQLKLTKLAQSIRKLEANLIDVDSEYAAAIGGNNATSNNATTNSANDSHNGIHTKPLAEYTIDYADELNPSQLLAATTIQGKILVIAGAGSGKTKTLTYRTSYLIENGASPSSILLLTFTRKAANEIKGRAKALLSASLDNDLQVNRITSGTFHSFCNRLLRQYSGLLGINPRFSILDTADAEDALALLIDDKKYPINTQKQAFPRKGTLQKIISTSRNRRILLRNLIENDYPDLAVHIPIIEQLAQDFHEYKRANHLYDFDDIIGQVVYHLKINKKFRKILQDTYRYVMVDEYQDTNIPQKQLIDYICEPDNVSLMVVGDDNQSIYAFRGANYENILLFGDTYPDAKLIKLEQNYRSTPAILNYVNALSEQITLGYQKQLFSDAPMTGQLPVFTRLTNEIAEAKYIASQIGELKSEHDYNDFAVLGRTSYQSNHIQLEFMERGIPFIVVGGIKFVERRHIKDVLALVKVLYNPSDAISWQRILTMFKGIGSVTALKLTEAINASGHSFKPLLDPKFVKKNETLTSLYAALTKASQSDSVAVIIDELIDFYDPMLKLLEENWRERQEDFRVLQNLAQEHSSLDDFLENLALDPPNDSVAAMDKDQSETKDAVTISTIHSAKGLEWPIVFVNALVDGMMPHRRSVHDFEELEEERKLFYVACSRAKTHLYLTAPDYFSSYSGYFDQVSRFVAEVPEETLDIIGSREQSSRGRARGERFDSELNDPEWW
ncbi:MAG: ATP-dependent helicase [Psychrobacter sp.]|nr:ATP-dependent helicase [Psychrobacter sp.]